jgi:anthranilate synthase component 2
MKADIKKTLIIDNYDSFVYNIFQYVGELDGNPEIFRNNEISIEAIKKLNPTHIIISPGPGHPEDKNYFGNSKEIILEFGKKIPILGVCLGHQGITTAFGGKVISSEDIMHGKVSKVFHSGDFLYKGVKSPFIAMRYHSLVSDLDTFPDSLEITSKTADGIIMSIKHKKYPIYGVQFHPESIGSPEGKVIIKNFLDINLD